MNTIAGQIMGYHSIIYDIVLYSKMKNERESVNLFGIQTLI